MKTISPLQFITPQPQGPEFFSLLQEVLGAGIKWVQLRMKDLSYNDMAFIAAQCRQQCSAAGAVFIINDHIDLALSSGADGVHLGVSDAPVSQAREILGSAAIIGGTANTCRHINIHVQQGADYIGLGPYQFTGTKKNLSPVLGIEGYGRILNLCRAYQIDVPLIAIGGIKHGNVSQLMDAGVHGIAVSSAISGAELPAAEARKFIKAAQGI
jgi:thiamine-phosphate pyrophosphorylase